MTKVLVVATSRKTRGGITAVVKAHEKGFQWAKYHCHWVQTHRDGNVFTKLLYLISSICDFLVRLPFYDIVHIHFSLRSSAIRKSIFVFLAKFFRKKVIVHLHCGTQIHDIWNPTYDYIFSQADLCLFLSEHLLSMVEKHTGKRHNFRVCYNPCPNIPSRPVLQNNKSILFSGTLCKAKGYHDLIKAFNMIANRFPDWKLVLAGNGEIEEGESLSRHLGIDNQVEFPGWLSGNEKDKAFRSSSIFCLPSYAEGFPMAVLDAWAYGLPVITTPVGGIPDVAKDGENMLLFNPGDTNMLAVQLERLMSNEALRKKIAVESSNFSKNEFNMDAISTQLDKIYSEITNGQW